MESAFASDRMHTFDAQVGMLVINPAQVESRTIWRTARETVTLALKPETLLELAEQELGIGRVDLQPVPFGTVDKKALRFAQLLKAELSETEAASELYVDSLITLFGIHLLRNYVAPNRRSGRDRGGLPQYKARRVRDYLNANLGRKLSVAELAAICDLSPGHFIQSFTKSFGVSPHQYLVDLRLAQAERLLVESELSIADVAFGCGFSSQSHLTTVMRRHKNMTPAQIRRRW
jgi:AraC family transcriptional regulator